QVALALRVLGIPICD
ncbi:DUF3956 family protein, partial [Bacillus sp. B-TM1]